MVMDNITNKKDLISMVDLCSGSDLADVLNLATTIKSGQNSDHYQNILNNKSMAMIFEKSSTRTRVSFEVAMTQLGGHSLFLSPKDLQLARGETVADTARVLSRYVDIIMYRAYKHEVMTELAEHSTVPVINALDDLEHPCQIVADLLTIQEQKGELNGLKLAYMGDGNNVCNSLLIGSALSRINMRVGCPHGYEPDKNLLSKATAIAEENDCTITITSDPTEAVEGCDIVYTDVWVSMGDEDEGTMRNELFKPYQVNSELVKGAMSDYIFMHCLPAHRGQEVSSEVIDSKNSVIFDQAENRLHAQKAIILFLLNRI
jgi:ornithine carbamoyltransferase